jgi:hypothetical protein
MTKLTIQQINQLATHLLDCPSVQNRSLRNDVLAFLQNDRARGAISRRDQDRADVVNIVRTCNEYPGALADLVEGVRCYDEDTFAMQNLDTFMHSLGRSAAPHQREVANPNQSYEYVKKQLCRIDFKRAVDIFQTIMKDFGHDGGAMLLLLQQSYPMGAEWLVRRIDDMLKETVYPIHTVSIGFASGMLQNGYGILQRLEEWFPVQNAGDNIEQYTNEIVERICDVVVTKKVIFIELSAWDRLKPQDEVLSWFVQEFWSRLVQELHITIEQKKLHKVHVIAVMVAETRIPTHVVAPHLCHSDTFVSQKILDLPLENWSLEDIQGWLGSFSPLVTTPEIEEEAQRIYDMSGGGIPRLVGDILMDQFADGQEQ